MSEERKSPACLIWCDLETTGLNPGKDWILEIYMVKAEFHNPLEPVGASYHKVFRAFPTMHMPPEVLKMHGENGLWNECILSPHIQAHPDVVEEFLAFVGSDAKGAPIDFSDKDVKPVLAGSTVHFDLAFLRADFKDLGSILSHRVYDVSALKLFCQTLGMPPFPKGNVAHRAKADIEASIDHAKQCMAWLKLEGWKRVS